jgi:hypothetical protein
MAEGDLDPEHMVRLKPDELTRFLSKLPWYVTPFIWGPPGVGKSSIVRALGKSLGMDVVILPISQMRPEDLIGIPTYKRVGKVKGTEYAPPVFLLREEPYVLFLDELNAGAQDVQVAMYSLILDRQLGGHSLPKGARVIAAGNRRADKAANVGTMSTALINRMIHVELDAGGEEWLAWADNFVPEPGRNPIHPLIVAFIRSDKTMLNESAAEAGKVRDKAVQFATPRSWHILSDALWVYDETGDDMYLRAISTGSVGSILGPMFHKFVQLAKITVPLTVVADEPASIEKSTTPILWYYAGQVIALLRQNDEADGHLAFRATRNLADVNEEVGEAIIDSAFHIDPATPASAAFIKSALSQPKPGKSDVLFRLARNRQAAMEAMKASSKTGLKKNPGRRTRYVSNSGYGYSINWSVPPGPRDP